MKKFIDRHEAGKMLAEQFNSMIHFDGTQALKPLDINSEWGHKL